MNNEHTVAGWLAVAAGILTIPVLVLSISVDVLRAAGKGASLLPVFFVVVTLQLFFAVYALDRFRHLLNERHGFHATDNPIRMIIAGSILLTLVSLAGRVIAPAGQPEPLTIGFIVAIIAIGLLLSIASIVFALRLRDLESDLSRMKNPFIYLTIAASICFATFVLAPVGMLLNAVALTLLGVIFLKPETEVPPEFV